MSQPKRKVVMDVTWDILDLEPFAYCNKPKGKKYTFHEICKLADVEVCVAAPRLPDLYVYDGDKHYIIHYQGKFSYCIGKAILPKELNEMAKNNFGVVERFMICLCAYGARDYFFKEVILRNRRLNPERYNERFTKMRRVKVPDLVFW